MADTWPSTPVTYKLHDLTSFLSIMKPTRVVGFHHHHHRQVLGQAFIYFYASVSLALYILLVRELERPRNSKSSCCNWSVMPRLDVSFLAFYYSWI